MTDLMLINIIAAIGTAAGFIHLCTDLTNRLMWTLAMAGNKMGDDQAEAEESGYPLVLVRDYWWFALSLGYVIYAGVFK